MNCIVIFIKYLLDLCNYGLSEVIKNPEGYSYKQFKEAYSFYKTLPKLIVIYRGCRTDELIINHGKYRKPWSLDPDVALFFAETSPFIPTCEMELHRYHVIKAVIPKKRLGSIIRIKCPISEVRVRLDERDKIEEFSCLIPKKERFKMAMISKALTLYGMNV